MEARSTEELFALCDRSGGPDACWPWLGPQRIKFAGDWMTGKRACWLATHGSIKRHRWVRHAGSVSGCCNPAHLVAVGRSEFTVAKKGATFDPDRRKPRGFKLDEDKVRKILSLKGSRKVTANQVAAYFGVHQTMVYTIWQGVTWKHVTMEASYAQ